MALLISTRSGPTNCSVKMDDGLRMEGGRLSLCGRRAEGGLKKAKARVKRNNELH